VEIEIQPAADDQHGTNGQSRHPIVGDHGLFAPLAHDSVEETFRQRNSVTQRTRLSTMPTQVGTDPYQSRVGADALPHSVAEDPSEWPTSMPCGDDVVEILSCYSFRVSGV